MELTKTGKKIYNELKSHCEVNLNMLEVDIYNLEILANCIDQYTIITEALQKKGLIQVAPKTGFEVVRPEVGIAKDLLDKIIRLSDKFGINPLGRNKILGKPKSKTKEKKGFDLTSEKKTSDKELLLIR
jgi:P27 family predicted phage terminase small subunit